MGKTMPAEIAANHKNGCGGGMCCGGALSCRRVGSVEDANDDESGAGSRGKHLESAAALLETPSHGITGRCWREGAACAS